MRSKILVLVMLLVVSFAAAQSRSGSAKRLVGFTKRFTDQQLVDVLRTAGYTGARLVEEGLIVFVVEGSRLGLFNRSSGSLALVYVVLDEDWSYEDINAWNRETVFSRAYLTEEYVVLESDLSAAGGLTRERLISFVDTFARSAGRFQRFLVGRGN